MTSNTKQVAHPWSQDVLLAKAQRYAEMSAEAGHDHWAAGLWAAMVLEFLMRACLSSVSPALLADRDRLDWQSLYFALGYQPIKAGFVPKSIAVSEVGQRLRSILPRFTEELRSTCAGMFDKRNEELHSGNLAFEAAGVAWMPGYYVACKVLLEIQSKDLAYLLGPDVAATAEKMIEALRDERAKDVLGLIERHRAQWGAVPPAEQQTLTEQATVWASRQTGHRVTCPSCQSTAIEYGTAVGPPTMTVDHDIVTVRQDALPARFECIACQLKIEGLSRLTAAGLGQPFTATSFHNQYEFFASEPEWEEDFNER